jgi:hypothetical protein
MRKYGFSALVAAGLLVGGLATSSASAADLGGNCCADLEERIAELEATTARKGNRKVSLTISGWVAQQVLWWDDGIEENVYVGGIGSTLASHFKMTGSAQISPGWSAGYVLQIEANDSDPLTNNADSQHNASALGANGSFGVQLLQSYWFIKSDHLGKVSIGLQSSVTDNAAVLVDGSGSLVPANWVFFENNSFQVRTAAGGDAGIWQSFGGFCRGGGGAGGDCFGAPRDSIVYNSPTFAGFSVGASWGEDDFWDATARYAAESSGFKVAAVVGYSEWCDGFGGGGCAGDTAWSDYFQAGLYVQHIASGLWAYGAYGHIETDGETAGGNPIGDGDTWYGKIGVRERWHPLGHTVIYGEYAQYQDSIPDAFIDSGASGAETTLWGAGIVQEIDAAAMSMWLTYRRYEADVDCLAGNAGNACRTNFTGANALEDFQQVKFGALINF